LQEADKIAAIAALLNHTDPGPGGYYDYLGSIDAAESPRLKPGEGYATDPSFYYTPSVVGPTAGSVDRTSRLSWSSFAMSFFDAKVVVLEYQGLDPKKTYSAIVVFNANAEPAGADTTGSFARTNGSVHKQSVFC